MRLNRAQYIILLYFFLVLNSGSSLAQILRNESSLGRIKECVNCIYNMKIDEGEEIFKEIKKEYPDHPAVLLLNSMISYWKYFPLIPGSSTSTQFEKDLRLCIERCEIKKREEEAEYLLTDLCARGILLLYLSDNGLSKEVMPLAKNTYKYIRRSFDFTNSYTDFYFFTGLYNYYREAYPDAHPIYKTFVFIFPKGDKVRGLNELQIAAEKAILLKAESTTFLTYIFQNYEKNIARSTYFSRILHEQYPVNLQFLLLYVKSLLLEANYDKAEEMIKKGLSESDNQYFATAFTIFNGILEEKKYRNYSFSEKHYLLGIKDIGSYGDFGSDFISYAYFGLSRLSTIKGDEKAEKFYRKKAYDYTDYRTDIFGDR